MTEKRYKFELSAMPPSVNVTRRKDAEGAKLVRSWMKSSGWELKLDGARPVEGPYGLKVRFHPGKTDLDLDNGLKVLIDLLHVMRLTDDDRQLVALDVGWSSDMTGTVAVEYWGGEKARDQW